MASEVVLEVEEEDIEIADATEDKKEQGPVLTDFQRKQLAARRKKQRQKTNRKKLSEQKREEILKTEKSKVFIEKEVTSATNLFHRILEYKQANPSFLELSDEKKFDKIKEWKEFEGFAEAHPIVSKYMCCNFMYDAAAFRSQLKGIATEEFNPSDHKSKRAKQETWARHQAFYVQGLFKNIHTKKKCKRAPEYYQVIWQDTYKSIMSDFDDFHDTYAEVEKREKEQARQSKAELVEEYYHRAVTGVQLVPKEHIIDMIKEIRDALKRPDEKEAPPAETTDTTPTVTMIEHVSEETYNAVDDKYKAPLPKDNIASVLMNSD